MNFSSFDPSGWMKRTPLRAGLCGLVLVLVAVVAAGGMPAAGAFMPGEQSGAEAGEKSAGPAVAALHVDILAEMPVQEGGRRKPYFVFASESLLSLTGKSQLTLEGRRMPAMEVITRMWFQDRDWANVPMILVGSVPLKNALGLDPRQRLFRYSELAGNPQLQQLLAEAAAARARDTRTPLRGVLKEASDLGLRLALFETLNNGSAYRVAPSNGPAWQILPAGQPEFLAMRKALLEGDQGVFDQAAAALQEKLAALAPEQLPPAWKLSLEVAYQKVHPFRWAWILFAGAALTLALTQTAGVRRGYRLGMALAWCGTALLAAGFVARILISGRAPVTNMYESIIWVAFGTALFALVFEALSRSRWFLLGASPVVVAALVVADSAPLKFDPTISPLVPVLQSNFWLTTHVLTITLSYAAFALALGIGHIVVARVMLKRPPLESLYQAIYRCLQVGVLLLTAGTLLGAVWANYSWGRFWDWDPKETWALVALLSYLILLHGRIAGKWGGFGLAAGSIICFQTIIMAWYGVNYVLGVGLHSYGFGSGGVKYAAAFVSLELLFAFVGIWLWRRQSAARRKSSPLHSPAILEKSPAVPAASSGS